ncbi:hypothetical protein ALC53_09886 [Atta colombica]|uniref:Uncharacterized protein n=1 Tax=Atta colombica TaxID=520822 RepID=A0A151I0V9_9HYME|nr:hypothetical protein ALC53_09886 [Atta colombica]
MCRLYIPPRDSSHTYDSSDIAAQLLGNSVCLHLFAIFSLDMTEILQDDDVEQTEQGETSISRSRGKIRISFSHCQPSWNLSRE